VVCLCPSAKSSDLVSVSRWSESTGGCDKIEIYSSEIDISKTDSYICEIINKIVWLHSLIETRSSINSQHVTAESIVVYRRRRLAKSELVRQSITNREDAIYYQAVESTAQNQREQFVDVAVAQTRDQRRPSRATARSMSPRSGDP